MLKKYTTNTIQQLLAFFATQFLDGHTISSEYANAIGQECVVTGDRSMAYGHQSQTEHYGANSHSSGMFASAGDAQYIRLILRNQTSDATLTPLYTDGAAALATIPQNTTWQCILNVAARRTDAASEGAGYTRLVTLRRDTTTGSTRIIGAVTALHAAEDVAAWGISVTADTTNGGLDISVQGAASTAINWVCTLDITQTSATTT